MDLRDGLRHVLECSCGDGTGFLIGSLAFGGYSAEQSDVDLLVYEDRDGVEYVEHNDLELPGPGAPPEVSICRRPLSDWTDPLAVLQAPHDRPISWKEFSAPEDAIMVLGHGVHVAGPALTVRPAVSGRSFGSYLTLRRLVLDELASRDPGQVVSAPENSSPSRFYSKAVARIAREHSFVVAELTPGRVDELPEVVGRCGAPVEVQRIVAQAASSLRGVPSVAFLSADHAREYLAWVNAFEVSQGRAEWAGTVSAASWVRRPIIDLRNHRKINECDGGGDG